MTSPRHVHSWATDRKPCSCGAPVPAYLLAAWDTYANRVDLPALLEEGGS